MWSSPSRPLPLPLASCGSRVGSGGGGREGGGGGDLLVGEALNGGGER